MTEVLLRAAEALLASAGSSDRFSCGIDFRLERTNHEEWQVTVVSPRARAWVRDELCCPVVQCFNDFIRADALSANTFVKEGHANGFLTEFVSLNGKDVF
ncbi:hypothetical protein Rleg10DRAFT_3746 [Rhizobium leguminosarum bv. trifolii WSM2012]|nr:hypothetical protein Rleg10DRAFT_3746 [Rhizobium leguminosarum bv. trifolii WSM2012]